MGKDSSAESRQGFEENFRKIEALALELQENKISIDQLVPRMKEALSAIKICKDVLKETRSQLNEINAEFAEVREKLAEE
jgi:exodeoxyribonuclease VII small subunit